MCHVNFQKRKKKELMQKFYENNNNNRDIISGKNLTTIIFNRAVCNQSIFFWQRLCWFFKSPPSTLTLQINYSTKVEG
jgi:hypothetical protein